jgi:DNA transformation protein and related proteins
MSMRVTDGFRAFVLEQLAGVESVRARAMFGGIGLYADDVFFGILAADALYLKVGDSNRGQYEAEGMTAFQPYAYKPMTMSYYQVPARVLEDGDELTAWARASVRVAARATPRKARRLVTLQVVQPTLSTARSSAEHSGRRTRDYTCLVAQWRVIPAG